MKSLIFGSYTQHILAGALAVLLLAACASPEGGAEADDQINPTVYYKPVIKNEDQKCDVNSRVNLIDKDDRVLATVCPEVQKVCLMQGSCVIQQGESWTSLNYHKRQEGASRFMLVDRSKCPFGYGVKSVCLDPYFSVAADLEYFKVGEVLFVPALVGLQLPTGETHDGFVIVRDKGGHIKGPRRIDFFIGYSQPTAGEVFTNKGLGDKKKSFDFRRADENETAWVQKERAYPGIKPELQQQSPF